jgi:hypothetical protein
MSETRMRIQDLDVKTRFFVDGKWLVGEADISGGKGEPVRVTARADFDQIERWVKALLAGAWARIEQQAAVGAVGREVAVGFFGFIKKAFKAVKSVVKKVANSSVVKSIRGAVKSVLKSKLVGYALTASAVVFPAVGIPAAAAFHSAQKVIAAAEKGGAALKKAQKLVGGLQAMAKKPGTTGVKARKALRVLNVSAKFRKNLKRSQVRGRSRNARRVAAPRRVRGSVRMPTGGRAHMLGSQKGRRITGVLIMPKVDGKRRQAAKFSALVSGAGDGGGDAMASASAELAQLGAVGSSTARDALVRESLFG